VSTTYILTTVNSDLGGGADFSRALSLTTSTNATLAISVAASATEISYGFTPPDVPGTLGNTSGTFTFAVNITAANSTTALSISLSRVSATGAVLATSAATAETTLGATGVKSFTLVNPALGTWSAGERLRVNYIFRRTNTSAGSTTVRFNATSNVVAPWNLSANAALSVTEADDTLSATARGPTPVTFSSTDKDPLVVVSNAGLSVRGADAWGAAQQAYLTEAKLPNTGKFYWEIWDNIKVTSGDTWMVNGVIDGTIARPARVLVPGQGTEQGMSASSEGYVRYQGAYNEPPVAWPVPSVVGFALDTATGKVDIYVNGVLYQTRTLPYGSWLPFVGPFNSDGATLIAGASDFAYPIPAGYQPYSTVGTGPTRLYANDANQYAVVSNGGLTVTGTNSTGFASMVRSSKAILKNDPLGRYFEGIIYDPDSRGAIIGLMDRNTVLNNNTYGGWEGTPGVSWYGGYVRFKNLGSQDYVNLSELATPSGSVVGFYVRADLKRCWVSINGVWGSNRSINDPATYGGDPFAGGPGYPIDINGNIFPAMGCTWDNVNWTANFGGSAFAYKPTTAVTLDAPSSGAIASLIFAQAYPVDYNYSTISTTQSFAAGQAVFMVAADDQQLRDATFNGQSISPIAISNTSTDQRAMAMYVVPVAVAGDYTFTVSYNYNKQAALAVWSVTGVKPTATTAYHYRQPSYPNEDTPIVAPTPLTFPNGGVGLAAMFVPNGGGIEYNGDTRWSLPGVEAFDQAFTNVSASYFSGAIYKTAANVSFTGHRYSGPSILAVAFEPVDTNVTSTPKTATLTDNFTATTIDASKWSPYTVLSTNGTAPTVSIKNGTLSIDLIALSGETCYAGLQSQDTFDLTDSSVFVAVVNPGAGSETEFKFGPNDTNCFMMYWANGNLITRKRIAGSDSIYNAAAYNANLHRWWRIRHSTATSLVYFDTAPATASNPPIESDWVNFNTAALEGAIALTNGRVIMDAGTYTAIANPGSAVFDGFNTGTITVNTIVTANASITEDNDAMTSASSGRIQASTAVTEVGDSVLSNTVVRVSASAAVIESDDNLTASAKSPNLVTSTLLEEADTVATTTSVRVQVNAGVTEDTDIMVSTTIGKISAAANLTTSEDTLQSNLAVRLYAQTTLGESDDTLSSITIARATATATFVESEDSFTSTGQVRVTVNATLAEANDQLSSASGGTGRIYGDLHEDDDTQTSTAIVKVTALSSVTEASDTLAATSNVRVAVNATVVETDDLMASFIPGPGSRVADVAIAEIEDTLVSNSAVHVTTTISASVDADTLVSSVTNRILVNVQTDVSDDNLTSLAYVRTSGDASVIDSDSLVSSVSVRVNVAVSVNDGTDTLYTSIVVYVPITTPAGRTVKFNAPLSRNVTYTRVSRSVTFVSSNKREAKFAASLSRAAKL
jgi:hypothetical protein